VRIKYYSQDQLLGTVEDQPSSEILKVVGTEGLRQRVAYFKKVTGLGGTALINHILEHSNGRNWAEVEPEAAPAPAPTPSPSGEATPVAPEPRTT
jgi:hypothetical protein